MTTPGAPLDLDALDKLAIANGNDLWEVVDADTIRRLIALARLGAAWEAAEGALPEGWRLATLAIDTDDVTWIAEAESPNAYPWESATGHGPTPAAALEALRAALERRP